MTAAGARPPAARLRPRGLLSWVFAALLAVFVLGPLVWLSIDAFAGIWTYPDLLPSTWTVSWWHEKMWSRSLRRASHASMPHS